MKKINDFIMPDMRGNVRTREGAIKKIKQAYEINKDLIDQRIYEDAVRAGAGGRRVVIRDYYKNFESLVLNNLSSEFGGEDYKNRMRNEEGKMVDVHRRIKDALEKSFKSEHLTPLANRLKTNFLEGLRKNNYDIYFSIKKQFKGEIPIDAIDWIQDEGIYHVKLPSGARWAIVPIRQKGNSFGWEIIEL